MLRFIALLSFSLASFTATAATQFPFSEFKKIGSIRTLIPLNNGQESLVHASQSGDPYSKVYILKHATKKLVQKYDAGQNVGGILADKQRENFYVLVDNNGDENFKISRLNLKTGKTEPVFGNDGAQVTPVGFSGDGKRLYVRSNHENKAVYSLYVIDVASKKIDRLTDGKENFDGGVVSNDESKIAAFQTIGNNEVHVKMLDLKTKTVQPLFVEKATVYEPTFFSPDDQYLYLNSNAGADRTFCARVKVGDTKLETVKADAAKDYNCDFDERFQLTFVEESFDGRKNLKIFRDLFGDEVKTPLPSNANISNFTMVIKSNQAVAKVSAADSPGDFVTFDLKTGDKGKLTKITKLNQSKIPDNDFAKSYDLRYKSFDGKDIHGIVFAKESWVKKGEKHPAIVWPHGGPDHHDSHVYSGLYQFWNMNGFVVLAPNFRGSTGYGKNFETLNDRDWGGAHIKDVVWGKRELAKLPYVDPDNIFIVGASFGGFSTLSAISQFPGEFKGAVAIVALANLFTFMKSIPPDPGWQNEFLTEVGDPVKDKALYEERSPYFHADKVKTPLKIYQADNDVRTVKAEMDQYVAKLRELKIPVQYEILEKDGHGIARTENQTKAFEGSIKFLRSL